MKEKTEPIFVRESLKTFLEKQKLNLKENNGKFYGMSETLLYYLEDSKLFRNDWMKYIGVKEETRNIFEFEGEELLGLMCHS